jgi:1-acyl-sn-glycerol-3-phosphate acyltransferase
MSQLVRIGRTTKDVLSWRRFIAQTMFYCTSSTVSRFFVGKRLPQKLMRNWCAAVAREVGIVIEAEDLDLLPSDSPRVLVVNHLSALDIPVLGSQMTCDYRWVAKASLFRLPFIGWHLWACGHIPVDRKRAGNLNRMNERIRGVLAEGGSVLFFAEGTRSRDGALGRFKNGAFASAVREGVPVVPIVIDGTERLLTKGSIAFPRGQQKHVRMRVLPELAPTAEGEFDDRVDELRERTRAAMVKVLDDWRGAAGAAERPTLV